MCSYYTGTLKAARIKREREAALPSVEDEFHERLNQLALAHSFAVKGIATHADEMAEVVSKLDGDPNQTLNLFPERGMSENRIPLYAKMRIRDVRPFLAPGGSAAIALGQQWLVTVYTEWDVHYRATIAAERGLADEKELIVPSLGDLHLFRKDIVHNRGIVRREHSGKVEVFTGWATFGQPIVIDDSRIAEFMGALGLVEHGGEGESEETSQLMAAFQAERERLGVDKLYMWRKFD
jgi:hypothetical protein